MPKVSFRGTKEGLCISFGEGDWIDLIEDLRSQLERPGAPTFFGGARVTLDPGTRRLGVLEIEELIALLGKHNMMLSSVNGPPPEDTNALPKLTVLPIATAAPKTTEPTAPVASPALAMLEASTSPVTATPARAKEPAWPPVNMPPLPPPETMPPPETIAALPEPDDLTEAVLARDPSPLFIRRTVRSGQYVKHRGSIVVLGDVNPGAELIASGDIIVWGKLRGTVHAGANGDEHSMIGALVLMPTQLRIAEMVARAPDYQRLRVAPAEIAHIRNGQIIVEPWSA